MTGSFTGRTCFAVTVGLALAAGLATGGPLPEWRQPAFPLRQVFSPPGDVQTNVILKLPRTGGLPVTRQAFYACTKSGEPLPFRLMHTDSDEAVLLVGVTSPVYRRPFLVYYGSKGPAEGAVCPEAAPDPTPVAGGLFRLQSRALPTSWERLRHMMLSLRTERLRSQVRSFSDLDEIPSFDEEHRGEGRRNRRSLKIAALRSFLLAPTEGVYRFSIDCVDAGFVLVDRELAADWPGAHTAGEWHTGVPVFLKAGVHRIDVYNAFDMPLPRLRVGWIPPGRKDVVALPPQNLVGSGEAMETRTERLDQTLQPAFAATPLKAYSFRGHEAVFVPVEFRNNTANWIDNAMSCRWNFGDSVRGAGESVIHTYKAADLFKAGLEVRDPLGFVAACSAPVDCRQEEPEEYAVAFDFVGLPAVCYARDRLAPYLRVKGDVPGSVEITADWDWVARKGAAEKRHQDCAPRGQPVLVPLGHAAPADLASIRWRVTHAGVTLAEGTIRFVTPPFKNVPARVMGDGLYDEAGNRLVLVPDETGGRWSQAPLARRLGPVVCVDDSLALPGSTEGDSPEPFHDVLTRLLTGVAENVRFAPLPEWMETPESYGPLREFIDVPTAVGAKTSVVVLSVGLRDLLIPVDDATFERQAAALSDLVGATRKVSVVWVTPPPYPSADERSRRYAAIIRRVAATRGIPVADLYTAFRCVEGNWHTLFRANPLELSETGQRLAAQQMARALVGGDAPQ